ncbi:hypothetical protein M406DRAFT_71501 [Cryphonectria parasitica EP155]|uniref:C2H2-type domain-containing protein n=1 Tax=Cryphonectria parasitica (strain ATCC 38755 / EP155) TaxID=660469 RepID=A0A9P4Y8J4_CRYP1|nr:uncharacterized protein M406DRAFT_71501 [Cryphonectria parasitica EP155]KAF3768503.1 hypothetical protein M406DRAFT_71501 [Cryphonectria parasitica EP155]
MDQEHFPPRSGDHDDDGSKTKKRSICNNCGKAFKDIKTHMITHKDKRPEKCPVKCSGTAMETAFSRSDALKKHLVADHDVQHASDGQMFDDHGGVETKTGCHAPGAFGKCGISFSDPQRLYDHLDDCVLQSLLEENPFDIINAQRLAEISTDLEDEEIGYEFDNKTDAFASRHPPTIWNRKMDPAQSLQPPKDKPKRIKCKNYPSSWGYDATQVGMKRRVMSIFNGPMRLAKDDMMLSTEHEVRIKLSDGKSSVTDLDILTKSRAKMFHGALDDQKDYDNSGNP